MTDADRDGPPGATESEDEGGRSREKLREEVEEKYDFDDFGPEQMAEMTAEEWDVAFDADTWITGSELLDRVERDLAARVAARDVFAVVERERVDGAERLVAYSDVGYALVHEDGSVEGRGTVLRDVKPSVALCSMEGYEVPAPPAEATLPRPGDVPQGSGDLGNRVLLLVGAVQVLAGLFLLGAWILARLNVVAVVVAFGFLVFGVFLLTVVANARLSDRFRSEEYRNRLRDVGVEKGERPAFVPSPGEEDAPEGESGGDTPSGRAPDSSG